MGTLMKNGIPYGGGGGGGDNSKTVTYEQYKNLSEAEKNSDTTFYVPDYPGDFGRLSTAMSWKTIGSATGVNPVVADFTKYDELLILVRVNAETTSNSVTIHILKDQLLPDKTNFFSGGSYVNTSSNVGAVIYGTTTQLQVGAAQNNGTDYKSSCEMIIYGLVYSSATSGGAELDKKVIGLNFYHNVDIVSRNACFKQNGVYYIDVMINVLADIPYTSTAVFEIIEDGQPITFNKRLDIFLQGTQLGLLWTLDGHTSFIPNSNDLKAGIYRMSLIYQP